MNGTTDRARPSLIDVLTVAGAAAALAAIPIAIGRDASDETKAIAGLLATLALLAAGALLGETAGRVRSVLWALAVLAWGGVVAVVLTEVIADGPEGKWLVASVAGLTFLLAAPLWWVERRSLQLIAAVGTATLALAALVFAEQELSLFGIGVGASLPDPTWSGVVVMAIGAAALVAGLRRLVVPVRTAMVLGSLWLIGGALFVDVDLLDAGPTSLALALSFAASVAVLVVGNLWDDRGVSGVGIAGVLLLGTALVGDLVSETGPAIAVIAVGVVLVAAGVVLSRARRADPQG